MVYVLCLVHAPRKAASPTNIVIHPSRISIVKMLIPGCLSILLWMILGVTAYHHGGNDTNCWLGPNYIQLSSSCSDIAQVEFTYAPSPSATLYTSEPFMVVAELGNFTELFRTNGYLVPHSNIHMCRAEVGWCTPDVSAQPDLVTQSPPLQSDSLVLNLTDLRVASPGDWSIVAHFTIVNEFGEWDVAAGFKRRFIKRMTELKVDDWAIVLTYVLASLGIVLSCVTAAFIIVGRNHWVFRASSPNLSVAVAFGCMIAFVSVFTLAPPSIHAFDNVPSSQCNARIWLLSLAFDFVLVPLALKTWRVSVLFASSATFKKVNITDQVLTRLAGGLLFLDCLFCLVWTLAFPLHVAKLPSFSNPETSYIIQCTGTNQLAFEMISIIAHGLPLIWLASIGRKVRSSFRKRAINAAASSSTGAVVIPALSNNNERKMDQFNESESLALTLASLSCVSMFAVALQYTVTDSPTAQMLMITCGVLWSAFFVLLVMFVPRFVDYYKLEKDGVTKRQSNQSALVGGSNNPFLRRTVSGDTSKRQSTTVEVLIVGGSASQQRQSTTSFSKQKINSLTLEIPVQDLEAIQTLLVQEQIVRPSSLGLPHQLLPEATTTEMKPPRINSQEMRDLELL